MADPTASKGVCVNGEVRRALWLTGADHGSGPCDGLAHDLEKMNPCPANGGVSTTPDAGEIREKIKTLEGSVAFFDVFGWSLDEQSAEIEVPESLAPVLLHWLDKTCDEMRDHSAVLLRRIKSGQLDRDEWLSVDDPERDIEDMLLERSYILWNLLEEFGVTLPLAARREAVTV